MLGATGHTGERLARRLLQAGHQLDFLSRQPPNHPVVKALKETGAFHIDGDSNRRWTLWEALEGKDALISCAHARYAHPCVQACQKTGVQRFLQMSSTRRFTNFPCPTSREVIEAETAIENSELDWTILRPTMIFGGRRDNNLTRLTDWFSRRSWFPVFGDGKNLLQPIYVEDLVTGIFKAIHRPEATIRRAFTLAGPEAIRYEDFLREIANASGVSRPRLIKIPLSTALTAMKILPFLGKLGLSAEQIQRLSEDKTADISLAREVLDFKPTPFHSAIRLKTSGQAEVEAIYGN